MNSTIEELMVAYDKRYPEATPFARGQYEYEARRLLEDLSRFGFVIVYRDAKAATE